jgi:hypothetical protein
MQTEKEKKSGSKLKTIFLILFIFLFAGSSILGSLFWIEREQIHQSYNATIIELEATIRVKDSLTEVLFELEKRFEELQREQTALADIVIGLEDEQQGLLATIKHLRHKLFKSSPEEIARLKNEVEQLKESSESYEEKIAMLVEENKEYLIEKEIYDNERELLRRENLSLTGSLKKAAVPYFGPITIVTGYIRRGDFKETESNKKAEVVRISYDLIENPFVNESSNLLAQIKIIAPDGSILTREQEIKKLTDKSEIFTVKHPFTYDGRPQNIEIDFFNPFPFQKGEYKVLLYFDGIIKQTSEFVLN